MYLFTAIGFCVLAVGLAVPLDKSQDTRLVFGEEEDNVKFSTDKIWHMEPDLYGKPGAILFSWGAALRSAVTIRTDNLGHSDQTEYIAGLVEKEGYQEGTGMDAIFSRIVSFVQIDKNTVIVADTRNDCLRKVDRPTGTTSTFAGKCTKNGYKDGDAQTARFYWPNVIMDERTNKALIVIDHVNQALRSVDISTQQTTTILRDDVKLHRPRYAIFDMDDKNILYVSIRFEVKKVSLSDKTITPLAGDFVRKGYQDGPLDSTLFGYWIAELVQVDRNHILVSDFWNRNIRILDLVDNKTTSLCPHDKGTFTASGSLDCKLYLPHSLMLLNDTLFVGAVSRIHKFPVRSILASENATACETKHISVTLGDGEKQSQVMIGDGNSLMLSAGVYELAYDSDGLSCSVNIEVKGADMTKRLQFELTYNFDCDDYYSNDVVRKLVSNAVETNYAEIVKVCDGVCIRPGGSRAYLNCMNGTLTATYPTDLVYGPDVLAIPDSVAKTLTSRLVAKGKMMHIVDSTRIPAATYPNMLADGSSARLILAP